MRLLLEKDDGVQKEDNHMKDILYSRGVDTDKVIQVIETKSA